MKKFTVYRSRWRRGGPSRNYSDGPTRLLNHQNMMCCLGFACNQICRIPRENLRGAVSPASVIHNDSTFVTKLGLNRPFTQKAIDINDNLNISDKEREERLTKLFADNGIQVTFKD